MLPAVQDMFRPMPGLIGCTGMIFALLLLSVLKFRSMDTHTNRTPSFTAHDLSRHTSERRRTTSLGVCGCARGQTENDNAQGVGQTGSDNSQRVGQTGGDCTR